MQTRGRSGAASRAFGLRRYPRDSAVPARNARSCDERGPADPGRPSRGRCVSRPARRPQISSTGLWVMWGFRGSPCGRTCGQRTGAENRLHTPCTAPDAGLETCVPVLRRSGLDTAEKAPSCASSTGHGRPENDGPSRTAVRVVGDDTGACTGPEDHPRPAVRGERVLERRRRTRPRRGTTSGRGRDVATAPLVPGTVDQGDAVDLRGPPAAPGGLGTLPGPTRLRRQVRRRVLRSAHEQPRDAPHRTHLHRR